MKMSGILVEQGLNAFRQDARFHSGHFLPRVWIVIADKEKIRIWRKTGKNFQEIAVAEFRGLPRHSGYREYHDENYFVERLSEWLSGARDEHVFDRIVLVASKNILEAFREYLPTDIRACIAAEIPKDLTRMDKKDLEEALARILVF